MSPTTGLAGKHILVIGGETPLGRAIAVGLAERGADVAIASLTSDTKAEFAINSALNELWAMGRKGVALTVDASDAGQVRGAIEHAEAQLGTLNLSTVVSAGEDDVAFEALEGRPLISVDGDLPVGDALAQVFSQLL